MQAGSLSEPVERKTSQSESLGPVWDPQCQVGVPGATPGATLGWDTRCWSPYPFLSRAFHQGRWLSSRMKYSSPFCSCRSCAFIGR